MAKAKKTRILRVLQRHIDEGVPQDGDNCPFALAIRELCPGESINVDDDSIMVGDKQIKTPANARKFIERFDRRTDDFDFSVHIDTSSDDIQNLADLDKLTTEVKAARKAFNKWTRENKVSPIQIKLPKDIC